MLLTAVPVLYTAYMASNRVLIVRNLLILVPFVAVLVALAVDALARLSRRVVVRAAIPLAAAALLALNWPTFLHTASSLHDLEPEVWRRSVVTYVEAHPDRRFAVSPQVAALLFDAPGSQSVTIHSPEHSDAYLYVLTDTAPQSPTAETPIVWSPGPTTWTSIIIPHGWGSSELWSSMARWQVC